MHLYTRIYSIGYGSPGCSGRAGCPIAISSSIIVLVVVVVVAVADRFHMWSTQLSLYT